MKKYLFLALLPIAVNVTAENLGEDCTTTEKIQYPTSIKTPTELNFDEKREAVMIVLGNASPDSSWPTEVTNQFKGQWFYEYQTGNIVYAGLTIRSHYLQIAIDITPTELTTIVCNSRNLKQTEKKIHRKVPLWKDRLDSDFRIALGNASRYSGTRMYEDGISDSLAENLSKLNELHKSGVLTDEEFAMLKQRLINGN
jgi:hypothetical protein